MVQDGSVFFSGMDGLCLRSLYAYEAFVFSRSREVVLWIAQIQTMRNRRPTMNLYSQLGWQVSVSLEIRCLIWTSSAQHCLAMFMVLQMSKLPGLAPLVWTQRYYVFARKKHRIKTYQDISRPKRTHKTLGKLSQLSRWPEISSKHANRFKQIQNL